MFNKMSRIALIIILVMFQKFRCMTLSSELMGDWTLKRAQYIGVMFFMITKFVLFMQTVAWRKRQPSKRRNNSSYV